MPTPLGILSYVLSELDSSTEFKSLLRWIQESALARPNTATEETEDCLPL